MSFIFISYSRQDQDFVSLLAQLLQSHNLPVWIDDRIDYGTTWPRVIQDHLERCQVFVVVMSPRSEESHWVQCELSLALELKKPIFPLLLEGRRWLSVAALQTADVQSGKLPPARFFDTLRGYFPHASTTAETLSVQEVADAETLASPAPTPQGNDLRSERGIDYTRLRDLLKAGKWKEADRETYETMIRAVGKKSGDWFRTEELLKFPCVDLQTIDRLWVKYSEGKWGFSVQKRIYVECGAKLDGKYPGDKIWHEFCRRVGWRKGDSYVSYSDFTFDLQKSPAGEFPLWVVVWDGGGLWGWVSLLSHRDL